MRPIRGERHAADDERTVEAPPEEPTLSAGLDVRAAFEAQDKTVPGAVVGLMPIEEVVTRQERTIPLVSPEVVQAMRKESEALLQVAAPHVAPPPPSDPVLPPPSDPVLVSAPRGEDPFAEGEDAVDIPGVGGAQRKRMLRIVIGVLSVCGLLCVGAVARQLLGSKESVSSMSTATATATSTATATPTATETATPSATGAPSVVASAEPSAPPSTPSAPPVVATAAPEPPPPPPAAPPAAPPPPPPAAPVPPPARARAPEPPAPARRPAAAAPAPHPRAAAPPANAKGRPPIVRDAPF